MAVALVVFFSVLVFVVWKPFGINEALPACAGAILVILAGLVGLNDIGYIFGLVWNATLALVAIIIISAVLDAAGFFRWAALTMAYRTRGSGPRLFYVVALLSAIVTVFFNNDGSVLIMTPIVYSLVSSLRFERDGMMPYLVSAGYMADAASVPLLVSNLVNILTSDFLGVSFAGYARVMLVPGLIGILASTMCLRFFFRKQLSVHFRLMGLPLPAEAIHDRFLVLAGLTVLGLVVTGYFLSGFVGIPVSLVAAAGALIISGLACFRKTLDLGRVLKSAPWHIVFYAFGMYLIVHALNGHGFGDLIVRLLQPHAKTGLRFLLADGFQLSALSSVLNNLPATLASNGALARISVPKEWSMAVSVIANGIGSKMTPVGSLATLLWIHVLARNGVAVSWKEYLRIGLIVTPAVLLVTLLGTYAWLKLIG